MKVILLFVLSVLFVICNGYNLQANYSGSNFFSNFNFFTGSDPTHGYVNYLSYQQAMSYSPQPLLYAGDYVIIGSDNYNVAGGSGRGSIRITSNAAWDSGLFILDLAHMPTGCGTWPAWWLVGPNWPNQGEIDIIEGVNTQTADQTTLHTSDGCTITSGSPFSGHWATGTNGQAATNCYVDAPNQASNQGCGIIGAEGSYGAPFNSNGGGVYALEWTGSYIRGFFFPRNAIPSDITLGKPNPGAWGQPYSYFGLGGSCPSSKFSQMNMVFDLTFCGDWAGAVFGSQCPGLGSCQSYVQNNPKDFDEAYWQINYVEIYQQ